MTDSKKLIGFLVAAAAAGSLAAIGLSIAVPHFNAQYAAAMKKLDAQAAAMGLSQSLAGSNPQSSAASKSENPSHVYAQFRDLYGQLREPNGRAEVGEARIKSACDQIIQASRLNLPQGTHGIEFTGLSEAKMVVKILAADAEAQAKQGNSARCAEELEAMNRISDQVLAGTGLMGHIINDTLRGFEIRTLGRILAEQPNSTWAALVLQASFQMKEPPLLASMPYEYAQIKQAAEQTSHAPSDDLLKTEDPDEMNKTSRLHSPDSQLTRQVAYIMIENMIQTAQAAGFQFCSQAPPAIKEAPIGDPDTWKTANKIAGKLTLELPFDLEKELRVRQSLVEEAAVCIQNLGSAKAMPYPLPNPVFVPDAQPVTQVSQAKPKRTVSLTDPFTQKPMMVKRIPGGFAAAAEVSFEAFKRRHEDASPYLGSGKAGCAIVFKNGKLQLINI